MEIPRHWRLRKQRYGLQGEVCGRCDEKIFPPRDICPNCHGEAKIPFEFSGRGEVYSFTTISDPESAPAGFTEQVPYTIALVKLDEGPMVTGQLTDIESEDVPAVSKLDQEKGWPKVLIPSTKKEIKVEIGMPVEMVTRKLRSDGDERGQIIYGYKFRPRINSS